jgi:PAS domain S-box-containing protein
MSARGRPATPRDPPNPEHLDPAEAQDLVLRMQLALEASGLGTWSWDAESGRVEWDATLERVYGLEPGTFPGTYEAYMALLHPDDRASSAAQIQRSMEVGGDHRIQHRAIRPNGEVRWIEGWGRVVKDPDGTAKGLVGVATDVTEQVQAGIARGINEERLARLQAVTSALADATSVLDVARVAIDQLTGATNGFAVSVYLTNEDASELHLLATTMPADRVRDEWGAVDVATSPFASAMSVRERRVVRLPLEEARGPTRLAAQGHEGAERAEVWGFPLAAASRLVGAITLAFERDEDYEAGREVFLETIGRQIGQALERARAREAEEAAARRLRLLAEASELLSDSLDYEETIARVAEAAVPGFADWCSVELVDADGQLHPLAVAHVDPAKIEWARSLRERYPPHPEDPSGVGAVIRTGVPQLMSTVPRATIDAALEEHPELAETIELLELESLMIVPLVARGRMLGAMSFVGGRSRRRFDEEDLGFALDLARRSATAIDNARLFDERNRVAATLETSLRPPLLPEIHGLQVGARYRPGGTGGEVAGDFYDVFPGNRGDWFAVVGDVSGKGAEAAAVMALARYTVRTVALGRSRPSQILRVLNEAMLRSETDRFCTATLLRLRPTGRTVRVTASSAGHPRPLIVRSDGKVEDVVADGTLLGVFEDPTLTDVDVELGVGDAVVAYTDGVTEERRDLEFFGEDRLCSLLSDLAGVSADELADGVVREVEAFRPEPPADDIAVLVLRAIGS